EVDATADARYMAAVVVLPERPAAAAPAIAGDPRCGDVPVGDPQNGVAGVREHRGVAEVLLPERRARIDHRPDPAQLLRHLAQPGLDPVRQRRSAQPAGLLEVEGGEAI